MEKDKSITILLSLLSSSHLMWEKENCSGQLTLLFTLAQALNFSFHLLSSLPPAFFMFVNTDDPPPQLASVSCPDFCSSLILLSDLLYHAVKTSRCKTAK